MRAPDDLSFVPVEGSLLEGTRRPIAPCRDPTVRLERTPLEQTAPAPPAKILLWEPLYGSSHSADSLAS